MSSALSSFRILPPLLRAGVPAFLLLLAIAMAPAASQAQQSAAPEGLPGEASFATDFPPAAEPSGRFAGTQVHSTAIDFNAFLHRFDAKELLQEMRSEILGGTQAEVSNYLLALAYSSPATASVLDMAEHKYSARYAGFAQARAAGSARDGGAPATRLAQAEEQCLASALASGEAPTRAWRRCAVEHAFGTEVSATRSNLEFLRGASGRGLARDFEALLTLLPDERVQGGALQVQAPRLTLAGLAQRLQRRARAALARMDEGAEAKSIAPCDAAPLADRADAGADAKAACLPRQALAIVAAGSWRASRLMPAAARAAFLDAFSAQVASAATLDSVLELGRRIGAFEPANAIDAGEARARQREMREQVGHLIEEAGLQSRLAQERARLVQAQAAALAVAEARLDAGARAVRDAARPPGIDATASLPLLGHP